MYDETTQPSPKGNWGDLVTKSKDPRIRVGIALDIEVMETIHAPALLKTKTKTRQGWSGQFMIFDIYEWYWYDQKPIWSLIERDTAGSFPETFAELELTKEHRYFSPPNSEETE